MNNIKKLIKKYEEILRYGFFGVLTTAVNFLVFYFFDSLLGKSYLLANFIAIILSILFAYLTNKKFVFQSETEGMKESLKEFISFLSLRLLSGVFDMFAMFLLVDGLDLNTNFSKVLTQFIVVISNYVFSKLFIFKRKEAN